jgi:hypothetical protein
MKVHAAIILRHILFNVTFEWTYIAIMNLNQPAITYVAGVWLVFHHPTEPVLFSAAQLWQRVLQYVRELHKGVRWAVVWRGLL